MGNSTLIKVTYHSEKEKDAAKCEKYTFYNREAALMYVEEDIGSYYKGNESKYSIAKDIDSYIVRDKRYRDRIIMYFIM